MSYNIILPDGTNLGSIADGTVDNTSTSLTLVGRNYSGYGQIMVDDQLKLLVNFAYNVSPSNPQTGQLWYDTANKLIKVWASTYWKAVGAATAQSSAPSTTVAGDFWWDSSNKQLYCYDGTSPFDAAGWILVGPGYSVQNGKSTSIWETINDGTTNQHVVSIYLDGTRTAIISSTTFIPATPITGFSSIQSGWNMNSNYVIYGTANNASYLGTQPAANYFRNNLNNVGAGSLTLTSNTGIILGSISNFYANVNSADNAGRLWNTAAGGNISLYVTTGSGSSKGFYVSGLDGQAYVLADPTGALGVASKQYVDNSFVNANLTGVPTAPTAPALTANSMVATTAFVINNSGFLTNKIYAGSNSAVANTYISVNDTGVGNAFISIDGSIVATATASGFNLQNGATAITQTDTYNGSGNSRVATTQFVKTAATWWGGSAKFVSTSAPNAGVNDGGSNDGDFWFQLSS
jgi:hypothetical protein